MYEMPHILNMAFYILHVLQLCKYLLNGFGPFRFGFVGKLLSFSENRPKINLFVFIITIAIASGKKIN